MPSIEQVMADWSLLANGKSGDIEIEKAWLRVAQQVFKIFQVKQADYGPANVAKAGLWGIASRLEDKIARWKNLIGNGFDTQVEGESFWDTLLDAADYPIIAALVYNGSWPTLEELGVDGKQARLDKLIEELAEVLDIPEEVVYNRLTITHLNN